MKKCLMYVLLITCLAPQIVGQEKGDIEDITTLCLEVNEIYPDISEEFSLPLKGKVSQFLSGMGLTILPAGEICDANLEVLFEGKATKLEFTSGSGQLINCYAQADYVIEMTLTLTATGGNYVSESADSFRSRLLEEDSCSQDAKTVPFDQAWQGGLLRGLSELWPSGTVYMNALETEDRRFHVPTVKFYLRNKPIPEAIPGLMRLINSAGKEKGKTQGAVVVGNTWVNPQSSWDVSYIWLNGPFALNRFGPEDAEAVPYFRRYLQDGNFRERVNSAEALGRIGPNAAAAVPDLCKFLQDCPHAYYRAIVAEALGQIGPVAMDAVPFIISALQEAASKGDKLKDYVGALKKITGKNFGKKPDRWQQWWEENKGR